MANRLKFTPKKRAKFIDELGKDTNVTRSACAIGMSPKRLYEIRDKTKSFRKQWDAAILIGTKALEDEATKRASEGWEEPVWYQGVMCGTVRKFSDNLLMFRLKAQDANKYRERISSEVTHQGPDGGPVKIEATLDPVEAAKLYHRIMSG